MADFHQRYEENAPGRFYTDILCLDCTVCREIAPAFFVRDDVHHTSYVARQPATPEEVALCEEAYLRCPCDAIGDDGNLQDWEVPTGNAFQTRSRLEGAPHDSGEARG